MKNGRKYAFYSKIKNAHNSKLINSESLKSNINIINNDNQSFMFEQIKKTFTFNKIQNSEIILKGKNNTKEKNKNIFQENDIILPLSKSFINEIEYNNIFKSFHPEYKESVINIKRLNTIGYFKENKGNGNNLISKNLKKELDNEYNNNINSENDKNPNFIDEIEIIGKNIEYLKGTNENFEINKFENTNKNNISYISIDLLIKKIALEDLRTKYNMLYKSFLEQFSIFLSVDIFTEKIMNAYYYYKNNNSISCPELINLLNIIILNKFSLIEKNEKLISKLKKLYKEIKDDNSLINSIKEDTLNVYFILFNEKDEQDLEMAKYSINKKRNSNLILIEQAGGQGKRKSLLDNPINKTAYFYIFDYTEEEIAIKLTIISYKLMSNITFDELLNSNFSKKDKKNKAPNVMKMIQRMDKLTLFIIEDIFSYDDPKIRAEAITKWIKIEQECKRLNNFNDTVIINTCFSNYLMKKIPLTWKKVANPTIKILNMLRDFCTNNQCYINIRKEIFFRKGRFCLPYIGILLKEVVSLEEKYKYILNNGNINCYKIQKLHILINQFFGFKNNPFPKQDFYNNLNILENLSPKNEDELELVVSKIEPKLIIFSGDDLKRKTKTDVIYYMVNKHK